MKLIVGLGNPGEKYNNTRHNLGFAVVEKFLRDRESVINTKWQKEDKFKSEIAEFTYTSSLGEEERVYLAKPQTYMNNSGMAVGLLSAFYKIAPADILIVYDELDLPLGSMKIRFGGAAAGHHGVESVMEHVSTDKFWRMRLGIGVSHNHSEIAKHQVKNAEDFVLGGFSHDEAGKVKDLIKKASKALDVCLSDGVERAMNQFNSK